MSGDDSTFDVRDKVKRGLMGHDEAVAKLQASGLPLPTGEVLPAADCPRCGYHFNLLREPSSLLVGKHPRPADAEDTCALHD